MVQVRPVPVPKWTVRSSPPPPPFLPRLCRGVGVVVRHGHVDVELDARVILSEKSMASNCTM